MAGTHIKKCSYGKDGADLQTIIDEINTKIYDKKPIDLIIKDIPGSAFTTKVRGKLSRLKFNKQGVLLDGKSLTEQEVEVSQICSKLHGIQRDNPINITAILVDKVKTIENFLGLPTSKLEEEDERLFDYEVTEDNQETSKILYSLNLKLGNIIVKNTKDVTNVSNAFSGIVARQASLDNPISVTNADNLYRKTSINVVDLKRFSNVTSTSMMFNKAILSEVDLTSLFESKNIASYADFGKLASEKTVIKMLPSPLVCKNVETTAENGDSISDKIGTLLRDLIMSSSNNLYTSKEIYNKIFKNIDFNSSTKFKPTLVPVKAAYQYSYVKTPVESEVIGQEGEDDRKVFYKKDYEKYLDGLARAAIYLKDESTGGLINTEELVNLINDADKVDRSGDIMRGTLKMSKSLIETASTNNNTAFSIIPGASGGTGTDEVYKVDTSGNILTQGKIYVTTSNSFIEWLSITSELDFINHELTLGYPEIAQASLKKRKTELEEKLLKKFPNGAAPKDSRVEISNNSILSTGNITTSDSLHVTSTKNNVESNGGSLNSIYTKGGIFSNKQISALHTGSSHTNWRENAIISWGGIWADQDITGNRVFNAVWNDLVDLIVVPDDTVLEYGRCYITDGKTYKFSEKYCQQGIIGIHSDTAGFGMGTVQGATQIHSAVAGYVLAFVDKMYPSGTPLTCGKRGTLTKMKLKDRIIHPERLVATFWKDEPLKIWNKQIKVNGRKWVKVI